VLDEGADELSYFASCGDKQPGAGGAGTPRAGVLNTCSASAQPVRIDGVDGDPRSIGLPAGHPPVHSFLGVPIASRERVHGWLYLVDKLGADEFSEVDERSPSPSARRSRWPTKTCCCTKRSSATTRS
jgi:signal transduction protein with GAF and PtsI domain